MNLYGPPRTILVSRNDRLKQAQPAGKALMRADRRDSLRATVFAWVTPLPAARCISGCAARSASVAPALSPPASAASTFLTKVRMRDLRAAFCTVRRLVCRMRLRADAVLAIGPVRSFNTKIPADSQAGRLREGRVLCSHLQQVKQAHSAFRSLESSLRRSVPAPSFRPVARSAAAPWCRESCDNHGLAGRLSRHRPPSSQSAQMPP